MNPDTLAAARVTAAQLLANLDDIDSREPLVIELLEQCDDTDQRLQSLGSTLAFILDALVVVAEKHPAARVAIATQIALLASPMNRSDRRAMRRGK